MNKYTIYCTEEQARKALKLGAPIETTSKEPTMFFYAAHPKTIQLNGVKNAEKNFTCAIPTAEQMIGFILDSDRGYAIDLAELIKEYGYKQGCLTFIENSLK